jgi:hypothetical protein
VIGAVTPLRPGMSLAGVARTLERAFDMKNAKAVALVINSPGDRRCSRARFMWIRQLAAGKEIAGAGVRRGCGGIGLVT